jgi:RNA polymerase sigma-70 factor (ECF subfamily)
MEAASGVRPTLTRAEEARLSELFQREFDFVWRCLRRFGLSPEGADDAAQQVFLVTVRRMSSIEKGKERSFLFGVAMRVAKTARRSHGRKREVGDEDLDERGRDSADPEELSDRKRKLDMLHELLEQLPEDLRAVLILHEIEGMTVAAIADMLEIPPGTVASRLRRARELFRTAARQLVEGER